MQLVDPSQAACEQFLAQCLKDNWQIRAVEPDLLRARLILSKQQLKALTRADSTAFHTYGLYLRALQLALNEAGLADEPEVRDKLQTLVNIDACNPHMSPILDIRKTVNKKLGVAPPIDHAEKKSTGIRGVVALILMLTAILLLVLYINR